MQVDRALRGLRALPGLLHALDRPPPLAGGRRPRPSACRSSPSWSSRSGSWCRCPRARSRPGWATERWGSRTSSSASQVAVTPFNLFVAVLGILLGTIIGVLPGLGGANGVAILLPLTFTMPPTSAIILLTSIYWGALFGGRHHLGAVQHPRRAVVGGHHLRRLSAGPAGAGGPGPDRRLHVLVRGRVLLDRADHALRPAAGGDRAEVRAAGVLRHPAADVLELRRASAAAIRSSRWSRSCSASSWPRSASTSSPASCD